MFDLDPHRDGGWLVAAATFVLTRLDIFGKRRDDKMHRIAREEIAIRFDGKDGVEARLARIETNVTSVKEDVAAVRSHLMSGE